MIKREGKRARAGAQRAQQSESQDKPTNISDVEERRGDYEWLAQSLLTMHTLETERVHQTLMSMYRTRRSRKKAIDTFCHLQWIDTFYSRSRASTGTRRKP